MKAVHKNKQEHLSKFVTVAPKSYASTNIEDDNITDIENYLPSASTFEIIERFSAGLAGSKSGRMISITGPYGSGKSTMAIFLNSLIAGSNDDEWKTAYSVLRKGSSSTAQLLLDAREKKGVHQEGLIRCAVTARREPITATILHALDEGAKKKFGTYTTRDFSHANELKTIIQHIKDQLPSTSEVIDILKSMCKTTPVVIIIDEFGKNIEYFTTDETQQSDMFLLQELAEMSGPSRAIPLSVITLQHMAFEDYAVGASLAQKQEWAKIQGRFEDIPFANSPDQVRSLISNTIKLDANNTRTRKIKQWAKKEIKLLQRSGIGSSFDSNLIASCYPLSPLSLEVLPELCSRYGQHERTLLSFISDGSKHTVATFIDEHKWDDTSPPIIGLDILYDHFISGTTMIHSSSSHITRLLEIETIIRDSHGLDDLEIKTLKTIGILNLIGRSGYLRASQRTIGYAIGSSSSSRSRQILEKLEKKSIITYRKYADEYRIWHGTDIDIAIKLDIYRSRYKKSPLSEILSQVMSLESIVAAKHSIETGTIRLFGRRFISKFHITPGNDFDDGVILYVTDNSEYPTYDKPVIMVKAGDTSDLQHAAVEVMALRDILDNDMDVTSDWVARKEIQERLADAEIILDQVFARTYGHTAKWTYPKNTKLKLQGTPSAIVSMVCNNAYPETPQIHNEMINRTVLSSQGSAAKRKLLEDMLAHTDVARFGIEGYGPDRAVYEAIFFKNKIHVQDSKMRWRLQPPASDSTVYPVWHSMLKMLHESQERVLLPDIYYMCKMPPFGMKDGVIAIFISILLLIHKENIALYEHGTYVPKIAIEVVERMIKNPDHFELKHFKNTASKKQLLATITNNFGITNTKGSVLDVVSHLVRSVSALVPYVKQTKRLDKNALAVRDTVLRAVEPDTLLFESLPKALGFGPFDSKTSSDIIVFSKTLTKSKIELEHKFSKTINDIKNQLFDLTGINNREKLSDAASVMLHSVTDLKMKLFLTAISSDTLERDEDWINYIALSLTEVPISSWNDNHHELFENNLAEISRKFKRLVSIHFTDVSDDFVKPSYQVTVTHADGTEHHNVVSLQPEQKKKMEIMTNQIIRDVRKKGFTGKDVNAFIAMLVSKFK